MNEQDHWDRIATNYNKEIFDVFASDRNKILPRYFKRHSDPEKEAIDFGCGTGKAFPHLSPLFKHILAVDISSECLAFAKESPYKNISFKRMDLSRRQLKLPEVGFAFCCNVIMLPEIEKNQIMINNFQKSLRVGGTGLIIVPSFDSILFSTWRLIDWYKKEGVEVDEIPSAELSYFKGSKRNILQGIIHIDGVPTKHYSSSEIEVMFDRAGLEVSAVEKLEYDWSTEFAEAPDWMGAPYPWDWLIECKKTK